MKVSITDTDKTICCSGGGAKNYFGQNNINSGVRQNHKSGKKHNAAVQQRQKQYRA